MQSTLISIWPVDLWNQVRNEETSFLRTFRIGHLETIRVRMGLDQWTGLFKAVGVAGAFMTFQRRISDQKTNLHKNLANWEMCRDNMARSQK